MNRQEFDSLLKDIYKVIEEKDGNFQVLFGEDEKLIREAKLMAAVHLITVDCYYSKLTKMKLEIPELF